MTNRKYLSAHLSGQEKTTFPTSSSSSETASMRRRGHRQFPVGLTVSISDCGPTSGGVSCSQANGTTVDCHGVRGARTTHAGPTRLHTARPPGAICAQRHSTNACDLPNTERHWPRPCWPESWWRRGHPAAAITAPPAPRFAPACPTTGAEYTLKEQIKK